MFERLIDFFNDKLKAGLPHRPKAPEDAALLKNGTLNALFARPGQDKPAEVPMIEDKPELLLPESTGPEPEPVAISEPQPIISEPPTERVQPAASKPSTERSMSMPLPSSISGEEVAMVQHAAKRTSNERFTYVDKPHKPLQKDDQKKPDDVIKYNLKPLTLPAKAENKGSGRSDVIVYGGKSGN